MELVRLKDLCEFINGDRGKNYPKSNDFIDKGIPFINAGHIKETRIDFSNMNYITEEAYEKLGSGKIQFGDILFCLRGSLGKNALVDFEKGAIASSLVIIRNKNQNKLDTSYLMYLLNSEVIYSQIYKTNNGSSQPNLSANSVKNYIIPLPDIKIQHKIVDILDKVKSIINNRKSQIEALDQLTQSVFLEMFGDIATNSKGWEYKKLSDICKNLDSKRVPITSSERKKGIYPYYGASGIVDYVNDYIFDGNYLLVSEDGANLLARVTPIAFEVEGKIWVNNHAHVLKFDNLSTQCFIKYVINLQDISHLITGSAQPKLNQKNLNSFMVPVPPLKLQNEFYEKVKLIEEKRKIFHSSLLELERLFNALLQKVFKGELIFEEKVLNL
ncbi:restriction endonuclease subunit S [Caldifermentibacillus hisashii]|uniref:restriction endonuclease subunit S n=1 Tax=Caldifermentibacillus hisashii TaxID=996558 RepID=UPI002E1EA865|nr:restriction endonuclease subunit S [Caldifermentibacillus hisashii]MED4853648.1 restriction endonuclease subunit S [Caldifermentibacillus hisashii]